MVCLSLGWMLCLGEGVCLSGVCNPWGVSVWGGGGFESPQEGDREIKSRLDGLWVMWSGGRCPGPWQGLGTG